MRRLKKIVLALAALCGSPIAAVPAAAAQQQFIFQGLCRDCAGFGIGTPRLDDYTPVQNITADNFVSFDYTSNLVPDLRIDTATFLSGGIPATPGPARFTLGGPDANAPEVPNFTFARTTPADPG